MPTSQKPILLIDNAYDRVACYPAATLAASSSATGHEPRFLADGRRERSSWQGADDGAGNATPYTHTLDADQGVGVVVAFNTLWLDRGHNLWGRTVRVRRGDGATFSTVVSITLPALGVGGGLPVGGNPVTGWCVTEEGAAFACIASTSARVPRVEIVGAAGFTPVVTGLMLGRRVQLDGYSKVLDEDAAKRTRRTEDSDAGWRATGIAYAGPRRLTLSLGNIGGESYDAKIRALQGQLFDRDQPAFICMDFGRYPERARLYQLDQNEWSFQTSGRQRSGTLQFVEVGAAL